MSKLFRVLYQPYKWLIFIPLLAVSTAFFCVLSVVISYVSKSWAAWIGVVWAKTICFITPITIKLNGRENIQPGQSYIIVVNHQSFYDVLVLYSKMGVDLRWIIKEEFRKVPFLGYANARVGNIFVDRKNSAAAIASLKRAREIMKNGTCIVFFPEGTRSVTGELGRFKKGAFVTAIDMQLPILPVSIYGTSKVLPATTFSLFPGSVRITIHNPIDVSGISKDNVDELLQASKSVIEKSLNAGK